MSETFSFERGKIDHILSDLASVNQDCSHLLLFSRKRLRYKETLLTTITGPLAKIFIEAHNRDEGLIWSFDFENQKIDIYRSEMLGSVEDGNEVEESK